MKKKKPPTIRKNIDLPLEVVKKIAMQAAYEGTNPKHYIQDLIIDHVRKLKK